jgi:hypothetical protein
MVGLAVSIVNCCSRLRNADDHSQIEKLDKIPLERQAYAQYRCLLSHTGTARTFFA